MVHTAEESPLDYVCYLYTNLHELQKLGKVEMLQPFCVWHRAHSCTRMIGNMIVPISHGYKQVTQTPKYIRTDELLHIH